MALLQPHRIAGIIPLGTSLDYESDRPRELGNFNAIEALTPVITEVESVDPTPDWTPPDKLRGSPIYTGFGRDTLGEAERSFGGMSTLGSTLETTDPSGTRSVPSTCGTGTDCIARLFEVRCPVLWLHGTKDAADSVANANEEIKLFVNSPDARLQVVEGGQHYLSASHPAIVDQAIMEFVKR